LRLRRLCIKNKKRDAIYIVVVAVMPWVADDCSEREKKRKDEPFLPAQIKSRRRRRVHAGGCLQSGKRKKAQHAAATARRRKH
jgi:hypothetical protein